MNPPSPYRSIHPAPRGRLLPLATLGAALLLVVLGAVLAGRSFNVQMPGEAVIRRPLNPNHFSPPLASDLARGHLLPAEPIQNRSSQHSHSET